jgi:hypothetical protein
MGKQETERERERDHVVTAEELKNAWLFPHHPYHQSQNWVVSDFLPVIWTMTA